jgi:hypothetical protein
MDYNDLYFFAFNNRFNAFARQEGAQTPEYMAREGFSPNGGCT